MDKVIYFTASRFPTPEEMAEIEEFNNANRLIAVRSASPLPMYGENLEACDFVAGTVPTEFAEKPIATPGGGGEPLPEGLNMIGMKDFTQVFNLAVGGTLTVDDPDYYYMQNGALSDAKPDGVELSYAGIPAGALPSFDGEVSFSGKQMTGVTQGDAIFGVVLKFGIVGPGQLVFNTYAYATVSGEA